MASGLIREGSMQSSELISSTTTDAEIGSEKKLFTIDSIVENLKKKLIHRHPHIYKNEKKLTEKEVENNWEKLKLKEKGRRKSRS